MKRLTKILWVCMLILLISGCSEKASIDQQNLGEDNPVKQKGSDDDKEDFERPDDYIINLSEKKVSLFDWEDEIDLDSVFGERQSQETQELINADTFSGSFLKTVKYDDAEVKLFSPKEDGKRFYILDIRYTKEDLTTYRGIKVRDSLESVKQAYPEVKRSLDGTSGSDGRYELMFNNDAYTYMHFLINDGVLTEIRLYHEFA